MMKLKFAIVILILLLTGCSINYDIVIDNDLSVNMNVRAEKSKADIFIDNNNFYNNYLNRFDKYYDKNDIVLFNKIDNSTSLGINIEKDYDDISHFVDSVYVSSLYSMPFKYSNNNGIISIKNSSRLAVVEEFLYGLNEDPVLRIIKVNIKVPFVVTDNNADYVNKDKNIFTWEYDINSAYKSFVLEFDSNKKFNNKVTISKIVSYVLIFIGIGIFIYLIIKNLVIKSNKNNKI